MYHLLEKFPELRPFEYDINLRMDRYRGKREQLLSGGMGLDLADLQTQDGADGVDGRVDADLLPDELIDVVLAPIGIAAAVTIAFFKI